MKMTIDAPGAESVDRARLADWLTAMVPVTVMALLYFRGVTVALWITAVGGYAAAAWLLRCRLDDKAMLGGWAALTYGTMAAFCLSAATAWWLSALLGAVAAMMAAALRYTRRVGIAFHPLIPALLLVRLVFPAAFAVYTVPAQFIPVDGMTAATPLALLRGGEQLPEWWQLIFGVHAGAVGEVCSAALLIGAGYLVLRRRVRLLLPACTLLTVAVLSWAMWGSLSMLWASLLIGGLLPGVLLFADKAYAPAAACDQMVVGVVVGVVTVLIRRFGGWTEGVAAGVLAGQLLIPVLPYVYRILGVFWRWLRPLCCRRAVAISAGIQEVLKKKK